MPLRYLALGDSYTIGEGVFENERWPNQMADRLLRLGHPVDLKIIAQTGWTTSELMESLCAANSGNGFDLVSLLIGVNNQYRGLDLEEYRSEFYSLLEQSIQFAGGDPQRVIALSIPDWSVTPFAAYRNRAQIAAEIDAFNAANREQSVRAGVRYVEVTSVSRLAADHPSLLAPDNLHPSERMYSRWVDLVLPEAQAVLEERFH